MGGRATIHPALGLLEWPSIAVGITAGDAMVKRSPVAVIRAGTVHPGRYLVLVGGEVADVEEAIDAGTAVHPPTDRLLLPDVHPAVVAALYGDRAASEGEALGVVETASVPSVLGAADAGVKGARVTLREVHLADDLGGKAYAVFDGPVSEVQAAVEIASARVASGLLVGTTVIARIHPEMDENLRRAPRFRATLEESG